MPATPRFRLPAPHPRRSAPTRSASPRPCASPARPRRPGRATCARIWRAAVSSRRRIIAASRFDAIAEPCALRTDYGLLWWRNTDGARAPAASRQSLFASGAGGHVTWIDPERGLVSVTRWLDPKAFAGNAERVMAALPA